MAIAVVEDRCKFAPNMGTGVVTLESDHGPGEFGQAFNELQEGMEARNMALSYAATRGMGTVRLNGNVVGPYPVNAQGVPLDAVKDAAGETPDQKHPLMQPARYRVDVPLCRPLLG